MPSEPGEPVHVEYTRETGHVPMSDLMEQKWLEMIEAFLKLTPEERAAEAERRLDETLERMAEMYNISPEDAYEKLIEISE